MGQRMRGLPTRAVGLLIVAAVALTGRTQTNQIPSTETDGWAYSGLGIRAGAPAYAAEGPVLSGELVSNGVDERDRRLAVEAAQRALDTGPNGTSVTWNNPANGHGGSITPMHTYQALGGGQCREYETATTIGGRVDQGHGTACRGSDGSWKLLHNQ